MEYILIALALIIGLIFGFFLKQVFTSKAILSAKKRADNILEETKKKGQNLILEAKEKSTNIIEEAKIEERERRKQL